MYDFTSYCELPWKVFLIYTLFGIRNTNKISKKVIKMIIGVITISKKQDTLILLIGAIINIKHVKLLSNMDHFDCGDLAYKESR